VRQPQSYDIPVAHSPGNGRIAATWWLPAENFKDLQLFGSIKVDPVVNADGTSAVRLSFTAIEEPSHLGIRIYATADAHEGPAR